MSPIRANTGGLSRLCVRSERLRVHTLLPSEADAEVELAHGGARRGCSAHAKATTVTEIKAIPPAARATNQPWLVPTDGRNLCLFGNDRSRAHASGDPGSGYVGVSLERLISFQNHPKTTRPE